MNKTLTINIGGLVFHIEEQAFQRLDQYIKAIRRSIAIEEQDEVVQDIELRIAEIFNSKITATKQVITSDDVDEVIQIMGRPEDYSIDDEATYQHTEQTYYREKKLFRDTDNRILGGVLAGLAHYFKIDTIWVRLIFIFLVFFYGTGILLYFVLWIIIPSAKTTSEKLDMMGEPVNIETIERKIREGVDYTTSKINSIDYDKFKAQTQRATNQGTKVIRYILGIGFIIVSVIGMLVSFFVNLMIIVNTNFMINEFDIPSEFIDPTIPRWILHTCISLITFLPFIIMLLLGLKLLYTNMKYIWITAITIFVLWIGSLIGLSVMMINGEASNFIKKEYRYNVTYSSDDKDSTVDDAFLFTTSKDAVLALEDTVQNTTDFINKIEIVPSYQEEIYGKLGNTGHQYKNVIQTKEEDTAFTVVITEAQLKLDPTFTLYLPIGKKVQLNDKVKPYLFHGLQSSIKPGTHWYEMRDDFNLHCTDCN
ncbi:PspC domain-containing protein [Myroides sp. 1354]|uniref:PspC domain-containing protein n=1 Tax=unclassified Myroides TaxID=2642485 RepID=UPI002575F493|nr:MULTISPECIES: PspC domain-containing protein [unclassified Myroides]MDM1045069.1 PspC domain-containing protein [Myroides sp. R163-1]MDM1055951.1 PspC domain-containing protein [Myroides sp. 1354]MDM1069100.1 PspC domain-containing protein [Myroides sp. 1372]